MILLISFVFLALVFSFLCSIAEAVILSVTSAHIAVLQKQGNPAGALLHELKADINKPLAAILTLNTIAHTVGAAGAGAQAAAVFGNAYLGIASAVLTLLILIFSEIIPKTLGAHYWRNLSVSTAHSLRVLILILYPFVKLSELLTASITRVPARKGMNRTEFAAMADVSHEEGELNTDESVMLKNLLQLRDIKLQDVMTPRTVVYSLSDTVSVGEFNANSHQRFSRIPIYQDEPEQITGFVLRSDLLLAQARGNMDSTLETYRRESLALLETSSLAHAFNKMISHQCQLGLAVDEYGSLEGIFTLEDLVETLLGFEIVDEGDRNVDMRELARKQWKSRAESMGIDYEEFTDQDPTE